MMPIPGPPLKYNASMETFSTVILFREVWSNSAWKWLTRNASYIVSKHVSRLSTMIVQLFERSEWWSYAHVGTTSPRQYWFLVKLSKIFSKFGPYCHMAMSASLANSWTGEDLYEKVKMLFCFNIIANDWLEVLCTGTLDENLCCKFTNLCFPLVMSG